MKLSSLTIGALLLAQMQAGAQTNQPKAPKPKAKTNPLPKPKKEKTALAKDSVKPINKNPDHYYCPPCGRG